MFGFWQVCCQTLMHARWFETDLCERRCKVRPEGCEYWILQCRWRRILKYSQSEYWNIPSEYWSIPSECWSIPSEYWSIKWIPKYYKWILKYSNWSMGPHIHLIQAEYWSIHTPLGEARGWDQGNLNLSGESVWLSGDALDGWLFHCPMLEEALHAGSGFIREASNGGSVSYRVCLVATVLTHEVLCTLNSSEFLRWNLSFNRWHLAQKKPELQQVAPG